MIKIRRLVCLLVALPICLSGCVSIPEINAGFRRIDMVWDLDYQKTEDDYRVRVIEAPYPIAYEALKKTFLDLNMPLIKQSIGDGVMVVRNAAPTPLTLEEWKEVKRIEEPRMKEVGGWFFVLKDDPKSYFVTVAAAMKPLDAGKTLVVMDYELDAPELRAMGVQPSRRAPPSAVRFASLKLWIGLNKRLSESKIPEARKRKSTEIDI